MTNSIVEAMRRVVAGVIHRSLAEFGVYIACPLSPSSSIGRLLITTGREGCSKEACTTRYEGICCALIGYGASMQLTGEAFGVIVRFFDSYHPDLASSGLHLGAQRLIFCSNLRSTTQAGSTQRTYLCFIEQDRFLQH